MTLVNTLVTNVRQNSNLDAYEYRAGTYGALDLHKAQTMSAGSIVSPELRQTVLNSIGKTVQVPVIDYDAGVTIGSSRSLTIADDENTSQLVTFTFATYTFGFTMTPSMHHNNDIGYQRDFEAKLIKNIYALGNALDAAALTSLDTAITQSTTQVLDPTDLGYTVTSHVVGGALADRETIFGDLEVLHKSNGFHDQKYILGNGGVRSDVNKLRESGLYNSVNKQFEYQDKIMMFSNNIANALNKRSTGYMVNANSVALLERLEREAIYKSKSRTGHEWGTTILPLLNMVCGTYYYESVVDGSALAGATTADHDRALKQHFGFAVDVAFVNAYSSDRTALPSGVIKYDVATT